MSGVKHYWPEEIVGTGELVVYLADYAALEADRDRLKVIADNYYALLADANAELARLRAGQLPVAAQVRFRRPEKGLADWSVWQQTTIKPNMPAWSIDSAGYEVEYRLLYTAALPRCPECRDTTVKAEPTQTEVN